MSLPSLNSCITLLADSNVWSTKIGDKEIGNGSVFVEIDTGKIYFYDAENKIRY